MVWKLVYSAMEPRLHSIVHLSSLQVFLFVACSAFAFPEGLVLSACLAVNSKAQARKGITNSSFWVWTLSGGEGVSHVKRWDPKVRYVPRSSGKTNLLAGCPGKVPGYSGKSNSALLV